MEETTVLLGWGDRTPGLITTEALTTEDMETERVEEMQGVVTEAEEETAVAAVVVTEAAVAIEPACEAARRSRVHW